VSFIKREREKKINIKERRTCIRMNTPDYLENKMSNFSPISNDIPFLPFSKLENLSL
jgi:hypothetical protein